AVVVDRRPAGIVVVGGDGRPAVVIDPGGPGRPGDVVAVDGCGIAWDHGRGNSGLWPGVRQGPSVLAARRARFRSGPTFGPTPIWYRFSVNISSELHRK